MNVNMTYSVLGLIILILDLVAIFNVLSSSSSVGRKVIWSLLIFFLPVVGMLLYFAVGRESSGTLT